MAVVGRNTDGTVASSTQPEQTPSTGTPLAAESTLYTYGDATENSYKLVETV